MAISEVSTCWESTNSLLDCDERSSYSVQTPSSRSTRSSVSGSFSGMDFNELLHTSAQTPTPGLTPLICSRNPCLDLQAKERLTEVLRNYILYRCSLNDHCNEIDFDDTALDALNRMSFLQALQTVEHFSASVSPRIQKRSAYLMGILRGQEAHWDKFLVTQNSMPGVDRHSMIPLNGKQILNMPAQLLLMIGQCCLQGNCLPSDFTPEVCLSLHYLPMPLALKSVSAFNSNKRIVAGCKGGVINRARFFLRLIQNVAEQNLPSHRVSSHFQPQQQTAWVGSRMPVSTNSRASTLQGSQSHNSLMKTASDAQGDNSVNNLCRQFSDSTIIGSNSSQASGDLGPIGGASKDVPSTPSGASCGSEGLDLNLEELADLDFSLDKTVERETKLRKLQQEIQLRTQREQKLLEELNNVKQRLYTVQTECAKLRGLLTIH